MTRQNAKVNPLARLFPNPAVLDVLALLLLHPDQQFYQRELAERTGITVLQVQRALKRIQDAGFVEKIRRGNRAYYSACREHPAFEDLKCVLIKTVGLGDRLRAALEPLGGKVRLSFVYGSVAAGTETADSDIDLLVVGDFTLRQAARVFGPLGRELGREFNPSIYSEKEFVSKIRRGNNFIKQVLAAPKIWLLGSNHELAQLVDRGTPASP